MLRRAPNSTLFPYTTLFRSTAASSAGASPTSRFSASAGTKPARSCSRRAAEYFAAQPPQDARSVSLTVRAAKRSEEHTSELQSRQYLVCRLLLEKKKKRNNN